LIIEAISFKLSLDFFKYLKKNRITPTQIRLDFYDRKLHQFTTFNSVDEMQTFFDTTYVPTSECELGNIISIQTFSATSDLYTFPITYKAFDVSTSLYNAAQGSSYDRQRNSQFDVFKQRQLTLLNNTVAEYFNFYSEIKYIYETGIYSPCYAEPGWSQNTWWLKSLEKALLDPTNNSKFPYNTSKIQKRPSN
jgi:hypothetical protein